MDKGDLATASGSGSGSDSDVTKKHKPEDPVNDSENDFEDDFEEDDFEDEFEEDEDMVDEEEEEDGQKAMAKWFITDGISPNMVNTAPFKRFMGLVQPNLPLSVPYLEKEFLKIHEERKEKVKQFFKAFQGNITLSYEWFLLGWECTRTYTTGPVLHEDFVCITAHFVDDNWKVRELILKYSTDETIPLDDLSVYHFRTASQGFEIENKVSTILLPIEQDFDEEAVSSIRKCIEAKGDSSINPPVFRINCCADLFRLMVDDVYTELSSSLIEDVRMLVGWGRCSAPNWNVSLFHLKQAVDMKVDDAFSKDEIYDDYDKPTDEEWIKIETFCTITGCIYKVAKELFEEGYSTSNVYFHLFAELELMLNQELESAKSDYFTRKAKRTLKRFDKYWNDMFLVLATASVLDPRFKMNYIEFYCSKKKDNDEGPKAEPVFDYLRNLYARYAARDNCQQPISPVATIESEGECCDDDEEDDDYYEEEKAQREKEREEKKKKPDAYKDFVLFQEFLKFEGSSREFQDTELDSYLKEPIMEWNKDFKALEWWKEESQKYPILSRVARDILAIPISRATSYDAYFPDKREPLESVLSMNPKVANAMMCGKSWARV